MMDSFEKLGINTPLTAGVQKAGITVPTGIQAEVIPLALLGRDVIGQSPTGTGKTLAYLLPIMQKVDPAKREAQALILAPTHELAVQIMRQIEMVAKNAELPVTAALIIGNVNITRQVEKLRDKPHIIVGSSGRIVELIQKKKIIAQTIKTIVIDEADRLLDDNNLDGVKAVIKTTLKDRQLMLFSATITPPTLAKAKEFMREPAVLCAAGESSAKPDIEHVYFVAEQRDKIEVLRKLVKLINIDRALVFVNNSGDIEVTVAKLNHHGLKTAGLYGSSVKSDRKKAMEDFRSGKIQLLVASDLAARGLDIPGVDFVFNLDVPEDPDVYLHRVGRTARAGKSGIAISIATGHEAAVLNRHEKILKINIAAKHMLRGGIADRRS